MPFGRILSHGVVENVGREEARAAVDLDLRKENERVAGAAQSEPWVAISVERQICAAALSPFDPPPAPAA